MATENKFLSLFYDSFSSFEVIFATF